MQHAFLVQTTSLIKRHVNVTIRFCMVHDRNKETGDVDHGAKCVPVGQLHNYSYKQAMRAHMNFRNVVRHQPFTDGLIT